MTLTAYASYDPSAFTLVPVAVDDDAMLTTILAETDAKIGTATATLNVDPQAAADTVIAVVTALRDDKALYARYKALVAIKEADFNVLVRLNRYAPALWLAGYHHKLEREESPRAVPEEVVTRGMELRDALHLVLHYHFHDDKELGPGLARVQRKQDHRVLANDLRFLATAALDHADELVHDRRYVPEQVKEALGVSSEIRRALGAKEVAPVRWLDRCRVLWSLVQRDYDDLQEVGRFLLRAQEDEGRRRFPSLVKGGGSRRKDTGEEPPANDTAPEAPVSEPEKP